MAAPEDACARRVASPCREPGLRTQRRRPDSGLGAGVRKEPLAAEGGLGDRHRAEVGGADRQVQALRLGAPVAGAPRARDGLLQRRIRLLGPTPEPGHPGQELPRFRKPPVVCELFEDRDRTLCLARDRLDFDPRIALEPQAEPSDVDVRGVGWSAGGACRFSEHVGGAVELPGLPQRFGVVDEQLDALRRFQPADGGRAFEQCGRCRKVVAAVGAAAGAREPLGGPCRQRGRVGIVEAEFGVMQVRPLVVVPEDLVEIAVAH